MALVKCPECKNLISNSAPACPTCGHSKPKGYSIWSLLGLIFLGWIAYNFYEGYSGYSEKSAASKANTAAESQIEKPSAKAIERTPASYLNTAKKLLKEESYNSAKLQLEALQAVHPQSPEAKEAAALINEIDITVKSKTEQQTLNISRTTKDLSKSTDQVEGITWYEAKGIYPLSTYVKAYFGTKENSKPILRRYFNYYSENWLFVESVTLVIDGSKYENERLKFERDNASGNIWEWSDERAAAPEYNQLRAIANSKKTIIRFNGKNYYHDHTVTQKEKAAISKVLDAYDAHL